jgi:molybdopterin converting factor small subunit
VVTVRLFAAARAAAGTSEVQVEAATVEQALTAIALAHPGVSRVLPQCSYLVDGLSAQTTTALAHGATLDVLPPFAGG